MSHTLLTGEFVIRHPDLPPGGPEPDGDTIRFHPDTPALVDALPRVSGRAPELNARGISVRLEAIDAPAAHFAESHQELAVFFADRPDKARSADQDSVRGHVLSNGIDANGRMIGFVFAGEPAEADGTAIDLDHARVDESLNARLLAAGLVFPAFYATLPDALRAHLARVARAARDLAGRTLSDAVDRGGWTQKPHS